MAVNNSGMGGNLPQNENEDVNTPQDLGQDFFGYEENDDDLADDENVDGDDDTADGETGDEGGEDNPPRKFAGMYNTVEELENAYKNLQTTYQNTKADGKKAQGVLESILGINGNAQPNVGQANAGQQSAPPVIDNTLIMNAFNENPMGTLALLVGQAVAPVKAQAELAAMRSSIQDFRDYEPQIGAILQGMPQLKQLPNYLEVAYRLAKADSVQPVANKAYENGVKNGYSQASQKNKNTVNGKSNTATRRNPAPKSIEDEIGDSIVAVSRRGIF